MSVKYYRLGFNPTFHQLNSECCSKDCDYYYESEPNKNKESEKIVTCSFFNKNQIIPAEYKMCWRLIECTECVSDANNEKYIIFKTITKENNDELCSKDCEHYNKCDYSEKIPNDISSYIAGCRLDKILSENIMDGADD